MEQRMFWVMAALVGLLTGRLLADAPAASDAPATSDAPADPLALNLPPGPAEAKQPAADLSQSDDPLMLSIAPADDQGIYTMPEPPTKENGTNLGGVNFDVQIAYFNHYVYRGVDHSIGSPSSSNQFLVKASTLNLQIDARAEFNLGQFPHPFVGLFTDIYDADPVSRFQEVRPYFGAVWTVKPFTLEGGDNTYIYPDRKDLDTAEEYGKITFDDAGIFHSDKPFFSPYFYGAYDYDKNKGWYLESGVTHDLVLEDLGLTLTFKADAAYIIGYQQQFVFIDSLHDTGFQHYDVGLKTTYSLNRLLKVSYRFGELDVLGFIFDTGKLNENLRANNVIWGGAGIGFKY
jgi:hypothetical protein